MQSFASIEPFFEQTALQTGIIFQNSKDLPGTVQYSLKRFEKPGNWMGEDAGMLFYHFEPTTGNHRLELKFCISGNVYCRQYGNECNLCKHNSSDDCGERTETLDFFSFSFSPGFLTRFAPAAATNTAVSEEVLAFKHNASFSRPLTLCGRSKMILESLLTQNFSDYLENIFISAQSQMLLLNSLACLDEKNTNVISCKFLNNENDRAKIFSAKEILLRHIGDPITIKQLSRKVAMNECYLKKGFKEMFGTTIFEFYQNERMQHAKKLLYEKGLSVTEVSDLLGYSSISHFSTAFKKHTGIKPCELLLRN